MHGSRPVVKTPRGSEVGGIVYKLVEVTPEGVEFGQDTYVTGAFDPSGADLLDLLRQMHLLPDSLPDEDACVDHDRGTWTISVRGLPERPDDFLPVWKLVGPWRELGA
jgi:hypothetical protein